MCICTSNKILLAASQITNTEKPCQCRDKKNITNTPGAAKKKPATLLQELMENFISHIGWRRTKQSG
jgi:hypothetical protein